MWRVTVCAALISVALPTLAADIPEPEGYRLSDYDAPVPDGLTGAITVEDDAAYALWKTGRVHIIDVMPDLARPKGLSEDVLWRGRMRRSIPGASWLPDAGFGALSSTQIDAFRTQLKRITQDDLTAPLLFLCRMDCWMSWNASKRALGFGYQKVFWYASGTTGWDFWDWPKERLMRADR